MTVTPQPFRAARRRGLVAAAVSVLLAFSPLAALPAAAETTPTPTPTDAADTGIVSFTLAPVGNGVVEDGENLTVSVKLTNDTDAAIAGSGVSLSLGSRALTTRKALSSWLDGTAAGVTTTEVAQGVFSPVEPGEFSVRGMSVAASRKVLSSLDPGIYPLEATVEVGSDTLTSTSVMIVPDPKADAVPTALVVPVTAGGHSEALLTSDELTELTAPDGILTSQLTAAEGTDAVLAIDPAIPASIRVLGEAAPASALTWLTDLMALPNDRFALQFGDADPAVQLEAGLNALMEPLDLTAFMNPDDFTEFTSAEPTPTEGATPTPSPTTPADGGDDGSATLPSLDDLLAVGDAIPDVFWPAQGVVSDDVLAQLAALGHEDDSLTILASRTTAQGATGRAVAAHAKARKADVLVYDADASAALSDAAVAEDPLVRGAGLAAATAQLVLAAGQADGHPLAVAFDRAALPTLAGANLAVGAVETAPGIELSPLADVTASASSAVRVSESGGTVDRVSAVDRLRGDELEITRFASILDDATLLTGPERAEVLQLLGTAWTDDADAADAAVTDHHTRTLTTLDSVALLPTSDILLAGSSASLRFWVRNDLPYPVNLVLGASSDNLRLSVQPAISVTATASSNTRVVVPVQARVGNGEVVLDLQLRSPTAVPIGSPQSVVVNVRAEWEGVGIAVLSVIVGVLLILGAVRTIRRLRARRRRGEDDGSGDGAADEDADSAAGAPVGEGEDASGDES